MKKFLIAIVVLILSSACANESIEARSDRRDQVVPVPAVKNFTEAQNISRRVKLMDDPNLVQWIYCLSDTGQVVFYGPVLGKVTSSGKRLEPNSVDDDYPANYSDSWTNERIQADGTYGSSDTYVYWFDPDGVYYQWSGHYFLTSVEMPINSVVLNYRDVTEQ